MRYTYAMYSEEPLSGFITNDNKIYGPQYNVYIQLYSQNTNAINFMFFRAIKLDL